MSTVVSPLAFLLQAGVKLTLLLGAVAILDVAVLRRRASAATRHLAWTCATVAALLLPLLGVLLPALPLRVSRARPIASEPAPRPLALGDAAARSTAPARRDQAERVEVDVSRPRERAPAPSVSRPTVNRHLPVPSARTALLELYLAGVVTLLLRLVAEQLTVRGLVRRATPVLDGAWADTLRVLERRLDVRRPVDLRQSPTPIPPLTVGIVHPRLLIPRDTDGWTADRREAVLLHELAHVRRHDCLTQTLAAIASALYWPHPLAWWAAARLRVERELACDDVVIGRGFVAHEYARHLLEIARTLGGRRPIPTLAVSMAAASQLEDRIRSVIDERRRREAPSSTVSRAALALAVVTVAPLAAAVPSAIAAPRRVADPLLVTRPGLVAPTPVAVPASARTLHLVPVPQSAPAVPANRPEILPTTVAALRGGQFNVRLTTEQEGPYPPGMVHLMLLTPGINTFYTKPDRFEGLSTGQLRSPTGDLRFSLRRDPGTLTFVGAMRGDYGTGRFEFVPNADYAAELARRGVGTLSAEQHFVLGLHDFPLAFLDELARQGYRTPTLGEVTRAAMSSVDLDYLREMDSLGYHLSSLASLVQLSDLGVDPAFIRDLAANGRRGMSVEQLLQIKNRQNETEGGDRNRPGVVASEHEPVRQTPGPDSPLNGRWTIVPRNDGSVKLDIEWADGNQWSRNISASELVGFPANDPNSANVRFRYRTDPGEFAFEGPVQGGRGSGQFTFEPNEGFAATLTQLGVRELGELRHHDLENFGFYGMSAARVREFQSLGLGPLTKQQLTDLSIREVTPDYVRGLQEAGVPGADSVSVAVELRFMRVPLSYVRDMSALGYKGATAQQFIAMYQSAVTPNFVRRLQSEGQTNLSPDQIIDLRRRR